MCECQRKIQTLCQLSPFLLPPPGLWCTCLVGEGLCFSFLEGSSKVGGKKLGLLNFFFKSVRLFKTMDSAFTEIHDEIKMIIGMSNGMIGNLKN